MVESFAHVIINQNLNFIFWLLFKAETRRLMLSSKPKPKPEHGLWQITERDFTIRLTMSWCNHQWNHFHFMVTMQTWRWWVSPYMLLVGKIMFNIWNDQVVLGDVFRYLVISFDVITLLFLFILLSSLSSLEYILFGRNEHNHNTTQVSQPSCYSLEC